MCKTINNYHFNGIVFREEVELVSSYQGSWWVIPLNYKAETLVIDNLYKKQKLCCCWIPFTVFANLQPYTIPYWTSGGLAVLSLTNFLSVKLQSTFIYEHLFTFKTNDYFPGSKIAIICH